MKYRIAWQSLITGFRGHGKYLFDEAIVQKAADMANIKFKGQCEHWIEAQEKVFVGIEKCLQGWGSRAYTCVDDGGGTSSFGLQTIAGIVIGKLGKHWEEQITFYPPVKIRRPRGLCARRLIPLSIRQRVAFKRMMRELSNQ